MTRPAVRAAPTAVIVALISLLLAPSAASAIGVQGVDLQPLLERRSGLLTATMGERTTIGVLLTNQTSEMRSVTVTTTEAAESGDGYALGGSADWIRIDGSADMTLGPGEVRELTATVDLAGYRAAAGDLAALVLTVHGDGTVVPQAATIIRLADSGATLPTPVALLLIAAGLLTVVSAAWYRVFYRDRLPDRIPAAA